MRSHYFLALVLLPNVMYAVAAHTTPYIATQILPNHLHEHTQPSLRCIRQNTTPRYNELLFYRYGSLHRLVTIGSL